MSHFSFPTANIFDPKSLEQLHCKDIYNSPYLDERQNQLQQHFQSSPQWKDSCKIMANEAYIFQTPFAQIMTDIFHRSKQHWHDFIENTTLSDLRRNHIKIFTALQTYQSQFSSSIYAPLHKYLSTTNTKFAGNGNALLRNISQVINQVKARRVSPLCGVQLDVRYMPTISALSSQYVMNDEDGDSQSDDDDDDDEYIQNAFDFCNAFDKSKCFGATSSPSNSMVSDVLKYANIRKDDTNKSSLHVIIRRMLAGSAVDGDKPFTYPRYEILMDNTNIVQSFAAVQNKTIPAIHIESIPLCRIYNSTSSVQSILDYLAVTGQKQTSHLMTFSIHLYHGHLEIYFYIYANGKLYGSRMFENVLLQIIPKLFVDEKTSATDKEEINECFKMTNVEFNDPKKYKQCKLVLFRQNQKKLDYVHYGSSTLNALNYVGDTEGDDDDDASSDTDYYDLDDDDEKTMVTEEQLVHESVITTPQITKQNPVIQQSRDTSTCKDDIDVIDYRVRCDMLTKANQELLITVHQKNDIIMEQKSEIEELRQQINELYLNTRYPSSPSLDPVPYDSFEDLADMTLDALNQFCDTENDEDGSDDGIAPLQYTSDPYGIYQELECILSDYSLDSIDISDIMDKLCTTCPVGNGAQNNHGAASNSGNFGNHGHNNNNHRKFGKDKRNNRQNKDNGNNNDGDDAPNDDQKSNDHVCKMQCNHMNECEECAAVNYSFRAIINKYISLIESIKEMIDAKKTKSEKRKQRVKPEISYKPDISRIANGNISISKQLTMDIMPNIVKEDLADPYQYAIRSAGLQLIDSNGDNDWKCEKKIINLDLYNKLEQPLFAVIERVYNANRYKWRMQEKLYTDSDLSQRPLPASSRNKFEIEQEKSDIIDYLNEPKYYETFFDFKWNKIQIFTKTQNEKRITLSMTTKAMNETIKDQLSRVSLSSKLIPILMFKGNSYWIEYIFPLLLHIRQEDYGAIGISIKKDEQKGISISGVHLNMDWIQIQHQLAMPGHVNDCSCFAGLHSIFDDIHIGNADDFKNQARDYKGKFVRASGKLRRVQKHVDGFNSNEIRYREPNSSPSPSCSSPDRYIRENSPSQSPSTFSNNSDSVSQSPSSPLYNSSQSSSGNQ